MPRPFRLASPVRIAHLLDGVREGYGLGGAVAFTGSLYRWDKPRPTAVAWLSFRDPVALHRMIRDVARRAGRLE